MQWIGLIPARYASTRFPGKPLAMIAGKPMIQRVYEQACKAIDEVWVATDDERIRTCVLGFGGRVLMTSETCRCGTERVCEALQQLHIQDKEHTVVVNIQGDEPFIQTEQIDALKSCFINKSDTQIATLVKPYTQEDSWEDLENPNSPKVCFSSTGTALLFSRSVIPYLRGVPKEQWLSHKKHYKHIGMYAYRADILPRLVALEPSEIEQCESLEQMRWIENGYHIQVAICHTMSIGIDTPEDLHKATQFALQMNKD